MDTSPVHPPVPRWREQLVRPHGGSDGPEGGRAAGPPGQAVQGPWAPLIPDPAEQPAVFFTPWGGVLYPGPPSRAGDIRRTPPKHPKPAHQGVSLSKSAFPRDGGGGSRCLTHCATVPPKCKQGRGSGSGGGGEWGWGGLRGIWTRLGICLRLQLQESPAGGAGIARLPPGASGPVGGYPTLLSAPRRQPAPLCGTLWWQRLLKPQKASPVAASRP